jgi:hypothetical protein
MVIAQQDVDLLEGKALARHRIAQRGHPLPIVATLAVGIGTGVTGIGQHGVDRLVTGTQPDDLGTSLGVQAPAGDPKPVLIEDVQHRGGGAQSLALGDDRPDGPLHFLVGIELDRPLAARHVAGGKT